MRKTLILLLIVSLLTIPVRALEITAPPAPSGAEKVMPEETESFSEGLWQLFKTVVSKVRPELAEAARVCLSLTAAALLLALLQPMTGRGQRAAVLAGTMCIAGILLEPTHSMIRLGSSTVQSMSEYGKLLLPVMATALAAQGGVTKSTALYAGTALFDAVLGTIISKALVPMIYIFLALSIANSALADDMLKRFRDFIKWAGTWILKIILYTFTGYMGVTGVISGTTDAAALKATKVTISSAVPVIGGILSEASETVLVSAGVVKNAAGIYGLLAILAICLEPFLSIGIQYLLLKATAAVCSAFTTKQAAALIQDFSTAMGLLLAITGSVCLLLLISTVCFMKGVS